MDIKKEESRQKVEVFLDPADISKIDEVRGPTPRSAFLRSVIGLALTQPAGLTVNQTIIGSSGKLDGHRHRFENTELVAKHVKGQPVYVQACFECNSLRVGGA